MIKVELTIEQIKDILRYVNEMIFTLNSSYCDTSREEFEWCKLRERLEKALEDIEESDI